MHAHLWRHFWRLVDGWGGGSAVVEIKGRATVVDVQPGRATARRRYGNATADEAAKSAAAFARLD
eukprot:664707-Pyramimonas_sp.AAC.1